MQHTYDMANAPVEGALHAAPEAGSLALSANDASEAGGDRASGMATGVDGVPMPLFHTEGLSERDLVILRMNRKGAGKVEIARALGIHPRRVKTAFQRLGKRGLLDHRVPPVHEFDDRIIEQYNAGWTRAKIAESLGISFRKVKRAVERLSRDGMLKPRADVPITTEPYAGIYDADIARLYNAGDGVLAISNALDINQRAVERTIARLVSLGVITKRAPGTSTAEKAQEANRTARKELVKELIDQGLGVVAIAEELGIAVKTAQKTAAELERRGEVSRAAQRDPASQAQKAAWLRAAIDSAVDLYDDGFALPAIASELGLPVSKVERILTEMILAGDIKERPAGFTDVSEPDSVEPAEDDPQSPEEAAEAVTAEQRLAAALERRRRGPGALQEKRTAAHAEETHIVYGHLFRKVWKNLGSTGQDIVRNELTKFQQDPATAESGIKKLAGYKQIVRADLSRYWRMLGVKDGGRYAWFWAGSHEAYNHYVGSKHRKATQKAAFNTRKWLKEKGAENRPVGGLFMPMPLDA